MSRNRKGSMARVRERSWNRERGMSKTQRKKRKQRMARYAEEEREKNRPPKVKRNGVLIDRKDTD